MAAGAMILILKVRVNFMTRRFFIRRRPRPRPWLRAAIGLALVAGLFGVPGCAGWETTSAPVLNQADAARLSARGQPTTVAELTEGRSLFVARCAACHRLPRPADVSADKWPTFIDEMAARSKLAPPQAGAVLRYLLAASDAPPRP
jgi:mono/diheme cytochrome c family protein